MIHWSDFKTVIQRPSPRTVLFEGQHNDELYVYFQILLLSLLKLTFYIYMIHFI